MTINPKEILRLFNKGISTKELSKIYGVTQRYIQILIKDIRLDVRFGRTAHLKIITPNDLAMVLENPGEYNNVLDRRYREYYIREDEGNSNCSLFESSRLNRRKKLQSLVFNRDDFKCIECGSSIGLETHHLQSMSECPKLEYDVDNVVTLCRVCHLDKD